MVHRQEHLLWENEDMSLDPQHGLVWNPSSGSGDQQIPGNQVGGLPYWKWAVSASVKDPVSNATTISFQKEKLGWKNWLSA